MTLSENSVVGTKDVQEVFRCSERTAKEKIKQVREGLGKPLNNNGRKGAPPITFGQLKAHFGLENKQS